MRKRIYCIIILLVAAVVVSCGSNVVVPSDALDLKFESKKELTYNGITYYKMKYREFQPVSCAWFFKSEPLGKAKVTSNIWTTGSDVGLNEYDVVKAVYDAEGNVKYLWTQYYYWSPTENYESIFDVEFSSIKCDDTTILSGDGFKLADIAYTDKCIPINSSNCDWATNKKLNAYNKNCPGQWYSFTVFWSNNEYYLGCCVTPEKGYIIQIFDSSLLEYLSQFFR